MMAARTGDDAACDVACLLRAVPGLIDGDLLAAAVFRPERFSFAPLVVRDDGVCRLQNHLGGAVVLLKADDLRAAVLLFKGEDVLDRRAAELVDGLIVVTDNADVLISAREQG